MDKIKVDLKPQELSFALLAVMHGMNQPADAFKNVHEAWVFKSICDDLLPKIRRVKQTLNLPYYMLITLEKCLTQYNEPCNEQGSLLAKVQPHILPNPTTIPKLISTT